jgi:Fic family protein
LAEYIRLHWQAHVGTGISRRERRGCWYEAYLPDPLGERSVVLEGEVAADVADAERAIARLDEQASALVDTEALARILLRAESVASSKIEGLVVGGRRLLRAEAAQLLHEESTDVTAVEVLGNIGAMAWAVQHIDEGGDITPEYLVEIHRRLLAGSELQEHAGQFRTEQNWIGGSDYNPCSAEYVPPPHDKIPDLIDDLCRFCNDDSLPAVAQAAIAHAQFETIHPFVDGNGRTGRALIHAIFRRRGLASRVIVPVSLVLATLSKGYISGLVGARYVGSPSSEDARRGINSWIATFAAACTRATEDALAFERQAAQIESAWRRRLGKVRAGSSVDLLLRRLAGAPIITVTGAAELVGHSFEAANNAVERLVQAEILQPIKVGRRNRAFEASEVIEAFTALERRLASPEGNTRAAPPERPVPRRVT